METIFYALLALYIVMLVFLLIFIDLTIPGNCVKCFFLANLWTNLFYWHSFWYLCLFDKKNI